jgi:glycosyltransferase involved in cell wall biosynthesis
MKLSILIVSLESREKLADRLLDVLEQQRQPDIEILFNIDDGKKIIGTKRNELLRQATGDYVSFVDDDDLVSPNYISNVLNAIKSGPDCVGIKGVMTTNGENPKTFIHSLKYKSWFEKDGIYYRSPNHLNPIKRKLALKVGFPEKNHGEDHDFSMGVYPLLKEEEFIKEPIYYYIFRT